MHRKTVHRWIAALALVAALGVTGAQPAAAADLADLGAANGLANVWSVLTAGPMALWETLSGWLGTAEKSATQAPQVLPTDSAAWTTDPNGED